MDKRELRLAIESKFRERRELIERVALLRRENAGIQRRLDDTHRIVSSRIGDQALDACVDDIMRMIIQKAMDASRLVAEITMEGDYLIGIDVPRLETRIRMYRGTVSYRGGAFKDDAVHTVKIRV